MANATKISYLHYIQTDLHFVIYKNMCVIDE